MLPSPQSFQSSAIHTQKVSLKTQTEFMKSNNDIQTEVTDGLQENLAVCLEYFTPSSWTSTYMLSIVHYLFISMISTFDPCKSAMQVLVYGTGFFCNSLLYWRTVRACSIFLRTWLQFNVSSACCILRWSSFDFRSSPSSFLSSKSRSNGSFPSNPQFWRRRWLSMRRESLACFVRDKTSRFWKKNNWRWTMEYIIADQTIQQTFSTLESLYMYTYVLNFWS